MGHDPANFRTYAPGIISGTGVSTGIGTPTRLPGSGGGGGGAAERDHPKTRQRVADARTAEADLCRIPAELLTEGQGRGVLGVGAADLDDLCELLLLLAQRAQQFAEGRDEIGGDAACRRDMHRGWERVVRRLAHVDVIVGMHRLLGAELAAEHLIGAVGDDL